ncbi:ubiquitin carboxyl-terminal hydrolase CYLD isoform X2 [Patella vulgata]|nr:ubiquitin carboxyl-terminal hydrolase CYLD isoform X2 [Patella vulgata]
MSIQHKSFILLSKKTGKKRDKVSSTLMRPKSKTEVLPGTLLRFFDEVTKGSTYYLCLVSVDSEPVEIECIPGEAEEIEQQVMDLLQSIPTCSDRLAVYNDKDWLSEGLAITRRAKSNESLDEPAYVKLKMDSCLSPGTIRFVGKLPDLKGIYFGVELTDQLGKGTCDGKVRGHQYFKCPKDSAVFIPISKLRKLKEGFEQSELTKAKGSQYKPRKTTDKSHPDCSLLIGDRVVWMRDTGKADVQPFDGTVKWIGILPDAKDQSLTVGVEFDKPIGSGTGKYSDHRLFYAKQNHASLIPILGLLKADEFYPSGVANNIDADSGMYTESTPYSNILPDPSDTNRRPQVHSYTTNDIQTSKPEKQTSKTEYIFRKDKSDYSLENYSRTPIENLYTHRGSSYDDNGRYHSLILNNSESINRRPGRSTSDTHFGTNVLNEADYKEKGLNPMYEYSRLQDEERDMTSKSRPTLVDTDLCEGWRVVVPLKQPVYGVIRWIGRYDGKEMAGIETDEEAVAGTDGTFNGHRYFNCAPKHAFFVPLVRCLKDRRFYTSLRSMSANGFGSLETPDIDADISPPTSLDRDLICGKSRGIQGHHNSCYLDSMLFSMFYFTPVFDDILYRTRRPTDMEPYETVQKVIKDGIVNPLRRNHYVRADKVMKLRELLDKHSSILGMMNEEKDPEEFLVALLGDVMKADPLLHLSSGEHTYFYQLFMEKDDHLLLPTTQRLVEISCLQGNVKFKEVPSCLIIQMPRFGKDYKMYRRIIPSLELDISDILENSPRECNICGRLAEYECKDCYQGAGVPCLNSTAFCTACKERSHQHQSRRNHVQTEISTPSCYLDFILQNSKKNANNEPEYTVPREKMELFAVICIQTSHYVSFVKCGSGKNAQWVFFDSMADRMGEQSGYNIPQVAPVPDLTQWLSEEKFEQLATTNDDDKHIPEHIRRLLGDAYMCMYQSLDVMRFK